jgi:hypothetical protein
MCIYLYSDFLSGVVGPVRTMVTPWYFLSSQCMPYVFSVEIVFIYFYPFKIFIHMF